MSEGNLFEARHRQRKFMVRTAKGGSPQSGKVEGSFQLYKAVASGQPGIIIFGPAEFFQRSTRTLVDVDGG